MNKIFIRLLFGIIKNMLNVIFGDGTDYLFAHLKAINTVHCTQQIGHYDGMATIYLNKVKKMTN